jgi:hypothetical protein
MRRAVLWWGVVALLGAMPAAAQSGAGGAGGAGAWPARLQASAVSALSALADSARLVGLPLAPLYDKAAEGVLKSADDARIVAAVRKLVGELGAARSALGPTAPPDALVAGAAALRLGVDRDALRQLAAAHSASGAARSGGQPLAIPLGAVADLVSRGAPAEVAVSAVRRLATRGVPAADYVALAAAVDRDILAGVTPEAAVTRAADALGRRRP